MVIEKHEGKESYTRDKFNATIPSHASYPACVRASKAGRPQSNIPITHMSRSQIQMTSALATYLKL